MLTAMAGAIVLLLGLSTSATADITPAYSSCADPFWGGRLWCGYPYDEWGMSPPYQFNNGIVEAWGVAAAPETAADHQVYTRWQYPSGTLSSWHSLGGKIYSKVEWVANVTTDTIAIYGVGGDNRYWCNTRYPNGVWSGWYRFPCLI